MFVKLILSQMPIKHKIEEIGEVFHQQLSCGRIFDYACDRQGYRDRVLDFFLVNNFLHRMVKIRNGKL